MLTLTARLLCHALNISNRLFSEGEINGDGDVKQSLKTLLELDDRIHHNLSALLGEDGDGGDLLSLVRGRR